MRTIRLWEVEVGRIHMQEIIIGADNMDEAISLAVEWLKEDKPKWSGIDRDDVKAVRRSGQIVLMSTSHDQIPPPTR